VERIWERLYVGNDEDCFEGSGGWSVVHACRHPCFQLAATRAGLAVPFPGDPVVGSLHLTDGHDLYLDLVDGPEPCFTAAPIARFLTFAEDHWRQGRRLLVHCNQGLSRSPSLALLLLARRLGGLPRESFDAAMRGLQKLYPDYAPGVGISLFLSRTWDDW
jgi:hypothetical protein